MMPTLKQEYDQIIGSIFDFWWLYVRIVHEQFVCLIFTYLNPIPHSIFFLLSKLKGKVLSFHG